MDEVRCNFYVGQKVVCVDNTSRPGGKLDGLCEGAVYTVRWIGPLNSEFGIVESHAHSPAAIRLVEIRRTVYPRKGEPGYAATRFRPATDISSLEALRVTQPRRQTTDA